MDTMTVELELPRDLLVALNIPPAEAGTRAREWVALELFREGHISSGKAAEMLGITKEQFYTMLTQRGIPVLDLNPDELADDIATALSIARRKDV